MRSYEVIILLNVLVIVAHYVQNNIQSKNIVDNEVKTLLLYFQ